VQAQAPNKKSLDMAELQGTFLAELPSPP